MLNPTDEPNTRVTESGWTASSTKQINRRRVLRTLSGVGVVGLAGCLGSDDEEGDEIDADDDDGSSASDGDEEREDDDENSDDDDDPYLREELETAIETLDPPDPGTAVVVFENDGEYHTEEVECAEDSGDSDNPEKGTAEGFFEFGDGEVFGVELSRIDDMDDIRNTITLTVANPDEDSQFEEAEVPRSLWPIKPEAGAEGRSAFVIREDGTWYGGIEFDLSDIGGSDYGETWVAITCD